MRFCQILTFTPAEHLVPLARHAEAVGFDSVACAICDSRTTAFCSPTGRSTRNGITWLIA